MSELSGGRDGRPREGQPSLLGVCACLAATTSAPRRLWSRKDDSPEAREREERARRGRRVKCILKVAKGEVT